MWRKARRILLYTRIHPVVPTVVLQTVRLQHSAEQPAEILVVWLLVKHKVPTVVHVLQELRRQTLAQRGKRVLQVTRPLHNHLDFGLHDLVVFLFLRLRVQTLPRQLAANEVQEDVSQRFKIVASTLLDAQMIAQRGVSRSSREILVLAIAVHN